MNIDMLVQQIASYRGWPMVRTQPGAFKIEVATTQGRTQVVQIHTGRDPDGRPMAFIWSVICEVSGIGDPYYLLRLNADLAYGALAVRDRNVILVETQLIESADAEEVTRAVFYVARYADDLEKQVYGDEDLN
ncbi:MAG: hypothetical protein KC620_16790 [Myxococcales bacterium]|nr:hypothetical protein [Myxococcales bacterium]